MELIIMNTLNMESFNIMCMLGIYNNIVFPYSFLLPKMGNFSFFHREANALSERSLKNNQLTVRIFIYSHIWGSLELVC